MNNFVAIFLMAGVTYIIRALPLVLLKKPIKSKLIRSALHYAPFVTLSCLTFPSVFSSTKDFRTALVGIVVAIVAMLVSKKQVIATVLAVLAVILSSALLTC